MHNETNQSLPIEPANIRTPEPIEGPFRLLHLADEIEKLYQEPFWQGGRNSKTLVKRPDLRIVLTGLKANHRLREHQALGSLSVQSLKGHIVMHVMDGIFDLPAGRMLALEQALPHALRH